MRSFKLILVCGALAGLLCAVLGGQEKKPVPKAKAKATPAAGQQIVAQKGLKAAPSALAALRGFGGQRQMDRREGAIGASDSAIDVYFDGALHYAVLYLEFDSAESCNKFNMPGTKVITRHDRWADIFIPNKKAVIDEVIKEALQSEGLVWFELDPSVNLRPPPARPVPRKEGSRAVADAIVQGGFKVSDDKKLTGKGVVVAIIDSGLDFRHPDFLTNDEKGQPISRCMYFWDTSSDAYANGVGEASEYTYPGDAAIGTVYDRETLTAEVRSSILRIPTWDADGHGTACAGVAGGNGNVSRQIAIAAGTNKPGDSHNQGVAPDVELIGVRLGSSGFENAFMLNAVCAWLDKMAGDRPLVVSCSFGGQRGGHDGYLVSERHLSSLFPLDKPSRAIVFSAGNEAQNQLHAAATVGPEDEPSQIHWESYLPLEDPAQIEIYVQTDKENDLWLNPIGEQSHHRVVESYIHPLTHHTVIIVAVDPGSGGLRLHSASGAKYALDAFVMHAHGRPAKFVGPCCADENHIGTPASAHNVLTIGSYDWNDQFEIHGGTRTMRDKTRDGGEFEMKIGELSWYSSPGPLRFGSIVKPEIVAPGRWYTAPASHNVATAFERDSTGQYTLHNGTSAATPYAAGVIALLFEAKPKLTWGEVRQILIDAATQDDITGDCPNPQWGNGKLDYAAVERAVKKVKGK